MAPPVKVTSAGREPAFVFPASRAMDWLGIWGGAIFIAGGVFMIGWIKSGPGPGVGVLFFLFGLVWGGVAFRFAHPHDPVLVVPGDRLVASVGTESERARLFD